MGNAVQPIKNLAWFTTDSNVHDGVAKAIYKAIEVNAQEASMTK
jgi:hydroxymethylpyrimidine pyrophosphatase-like HAD family hydrolase